MLTKPRSLLLQKKGAMLPIPGAGGVGGIDVADMDSLAHHSLDDPAAPANNYNPFYGKGTEMDSLKSASGEWERQTVGFRCPHCGMERVLSKENHMKNFHPEKEALPGLRKFVEKWKPTPMGPETETSFGLAPPPKPPQSPAKLPIRQEKMQDAWNAPAHRASLKLADNSICVCGHQWHEHWHKGNFGCKIKGTKCKCKGFKAKTGSFNPLLRSKKADLSDIWSTGSEGLGDQEDFRATLKAEQEDPDGYLFRSETYCPRCGQALIDELLDTQQVGPPAPNEDAEWTKDSEIVPQAIISLELGMETCGKCGDDIRPETREPGELSDPDRAFLKDFRISASLRGLSERVKSKSSNPLLNTQPPNPETATFFKESDKDNPHCPHCGSDDYGLMPTDFETAKCNKCGKNWDHGIVPGINDPKTASEKSYGAGTPLGGTANGAGQPAPSEDPTHPAGFQQPPAPVTPSTTSQTTTGTTPSTTSPGQPSKPETTMNMGLQNQMAQDVINILQDQKTGNVELSQVVRTDEGTDKPGRSDIKRHIDKSLLDKDYAPPIPLSKGAGWTGEDEPDDEEVTDLGTRYGVPIYSLPKDEYASTESQPLVLCPICKQGVRGPIETHNEIFHNIVLDGPDYKCPICGKNWVNYTQGQKNFHTENHLAQKGQEGGWNWKITCPACKKTLNAFTKDDTDNAFYKHWTSAHTKPVPKGDEVQAVPYKLDSKLNQPPPDAPSKGKLQLTKEDKDFLKQVGIKQSKVAAVDAETWWRNTVNTKRREVADRLGIDKYWSHFVWESLPPETQEKVKASFPVIVDDERQGEVQKAWDAPAHLAAGKDWDPLLARELYEQGLEAATEGDWDGAFKAIRQSLAHNPYNGPAHFIMGIILAQEGETQVAIDELQSSLTTTPKKEYVYHSLVTEMSNRGDLDGIPEEVKNYLLDNMVSKKAGKQVADPYPTLTDYDIKESVKRLGKRKDEKSRKAIGAMEAELKRRGENREKTAETGTWWRSCETCGKPALELKKGENVRGPVWCDECSGSKTAKALGAPVKERKTAVQIEEGVNLVCPNCKGTETKPVNEPEAEDGNLVECTTCGAFFDSN